LGWLYLKKREEMGIGLPALKCRQRKLTLFLQDRTKNMGSLGFQRGGSDEKKVIVKTCIGKIRRFTNYPYFRVSKII